MKRTASTLPVILLPIGVQRGWDHMMDGWHMWGWGGWAMVIIWVVLLAALVYIVTRTARPETHPRSAAAPESPLDVLKKRYARGEISKEEFEEKKRDLG